MKSLVVFWSGTGNTEEMAKAVYKGALTKGECDLVNVSDNPSVEDYDVVFFGCPAMGAEELEECEFEPYFESVKDKLAGKKIGLFGSHDWGDGEWMELWLERCSGLSCEVLGSVICNLTPDDSGLEECFNLGAKA